MDLLPVGCIKYPQIAQVDHVKSLLSLIIIGRFSCKNSRCSLVLYGVKKIFVVAWEQDFSYFYFPKILLVLLVSLLLTSTTASLAARAKISAQETTPGHNASNAFFALSMTKNACKEPFAGPSFSAVFLFTEFNKTEASQPCEIKGNKQVKTV